MANPVPMVEIWRGPFLESLHLGHAVVCNADGEIVEAWGDPQAVVLPRSSSKMIQALPLIESGAADAAGPVWLHLIRADGTSSLTCWNDQGLNGCSRQFPRVTSDGLESLTGGCFTG